MRCRLLIIFSVLVLLLAGACVNEQDIEFKRAYTTGAVVYQQHCQNCHGFHGEGLLGLMPPLTDTAFLIKNNKKLTCIINEGANQLMLVGKQPYNNKMPPSGLAPVEISQVLTYINNSFGNKRGLISLEQVTKDLKACE